MSVFLLILAPILLGYVQGIPEIISGGATVREDVPIGDFAFQVNATETENLPLTYKFVTDGDYAEPASFFSINPNTGEVTVAKTLDREADTVLSVQVEVSSIGYARAIFPVFLEDANDNAPIFENGPFNVEIEENSPVGTLLFHATAVDRDFSQAGAVTYSIPEAIPEEGLSLFSMFQTGEVKLAGTLNYSRNSFYQLDIMAKDGGGLHHGVMVNRSTVIGASIRVKDVPDLDPQFLRLPYVASVKEHASIGSSVFQVEAYDPDTQVRDTIHYSISDSSKPGLFSIDQISGVISVFSDIDRENLLDINAEVILTVEAKELNLNVDGIRASCTTQVKINVLDINDQKPLFYECDTDPCDFSKEAQSFTGSVEEGSSRGVVVAGVNMAVRDLDAGGQAPFDLHLEGPDKNAFSVTSLPGGFVQISVDNRQDIDYEKKKTMDVQVVAKDIFRPEDCCSIASVLIYVNDTNDNDPTFQHESYTLRVKEHSEVGHVIGTITATDPDTADEGKLRYSLASGSILQFFSVDPNNGTIMVRSSKLDRETRSFYSTNLQATDSAGGTGFTNLEITVLDINDHNPEIMRDKYEANIMEGPGKRLEIQIQARDNDEEGTNNSRLGYAILPSEFSQNFTISETTGLLENNGPLDREAIDPLDNGLIELNVSVYDMGVPRGISYVAVLITVQDVNDNTPQFKQHYYNFSVKESTKGEFVGSVSAYDEDQELFYNRISFNIANGGLASFIVESLEAEDGIGYIGKISLDQDIELDYEQRKEPYIFEVEARDVDGQKDMAVVEVHVLEVNDERPVIPSGQSLLVVENTNETLVGFLKGEDVDVNHSLTFELLSSECHCNGTMGPCEEDWFILHPSGEVTVNPEVVIDYEVCDQVILEAQVLDTLTEKGLNNSLPGFLQINIEDVNDNVPQFIVSQTIFIVVNEKTEKGTSVASVSANDQDSLKNKEITFNILKTQFVDTNNQITNEALFLVDTATEGEVYVGTIETIGSIKGDRKGKYLVTVEAINSEATPQLKNSTLIEIYTIDSSYRVELYFESSVEEVNEKIPQIRSTLSAATKATVHILRTVAVGSEQRAETVTLLEAYFLYVNGTAIQPDNVEKVLQEDLYHANILKNLGLTGIVSGVTNTPVIDTVRIILLGLVAGLLIVLVVMTTSLVCTQRNYKRKLKAAKALNSAAMLDTENLKPGAIVPGSNQMKANPVLNLNIDTTTDLGFDEDESTTDKESINSLDYDLNTDMQEKDTKPMMAIEEEDEEQDDHVYVEPLDFALATRGKRKQAPGAPHSFVNPTLDTTDL